MRLLLAAFALIGASVTVAPPGAVRAQALGQSCQMHAAGDTSAPEPVRRFLERRPGYLVSACASDAGATYQALSTVVVEAPGVCRMSVRRYSQAGFAAAAEGREPEAAAFDFMALPDAGECPERGKGRWAAVTEVSDADFLQLHRFVVSLTRGGRSDHPDGACRRREDKLRRVVLAHALIAVRREAPGVYAIQLLRSGMGYTASVELTPKGACVRAFGQFIV